MITAVDSSVLYDVLNEDPTFSVAAERTLFSCRAEGRVLACEIVWAEVATRYPSSNAARAALNALQIEFSPLGENAALLAGDKWREYRRRGGPRTRVVPDFLIGAHASTHADRLLTRDRGFYRSYFRGLTVLDPSKT
jgi:predicted nucleic acid-binding protein